VSGDHGHALVYSMGVSLDGFVAGPDREIDWAAPDEELHRFHNEQMRAVDAHLCGRRLYEEMLYWETAGDDVAETAGDDVAETAGDDAAADAPERSEPEREFAAIWQRLPKLVFSSTLERVEGNATLASEDLAAEIAKLGQQPGAGELAIGGAGLAAKAIELDLIDEYRPFVSPVVLGGGTPFLPRGVRLDLELLETRTFASRVVYLRYRRVRPSRP
jgi:dihydrofolate reductase